MLLSLVSCNGSDTPTVGETGTENVYYSAKLNNVYKKGIRKDAFFSALIDKITQTN